MSFEMLAGAIALLMALRWFAFEGLLIMKRWQRRIFFAAAPNAALPALRVHWEMLLRAVAPWRPSWAGREMAQPAARTVLPGRPCPQVRNR